MRLSLTQQAALMFLWNAPAYQRRTRELRKQTSDALIRKGYIETLRIGNSLVYKLTHAGIRYCQTGKLIGE